MGDCNCPAIHGPGKARCKHSAGPQDNLFTQLPGAPTWALDAHLDPVLAKMKELVRHVIVRRNNCTHTHTHRDIQKHPGNRNKRERAEMI